MKKVLIIEDDKGIAELERDYLEAMDLKSRWHLRVFREKKQP